MRSRACCGLVPATTGDSPAATASAATTATAATAASAVTTAPANRAAAGPRNVFILLVLAGVLLPFPAGPVSILGAAFLALRSRMRPWIPAVLVAGAIALTAPALTR